MQVLPIPVSADAFKLGRLGLEWAILSAQGPPLARCAGAGGGGGGCEGAGWLSPVKKVIAPPGRRYSRHSLSRWHVRVWAQVRWGPAAGGWAAEAPRTRSLRPAPTSPRRQTTTTSPRTKLWLRQKVFISEAIINWWLISILSDTIQKKSRKGWSLQCVVNQTFSKMMLSIHPYDDRKTNWLKLNIKTYWGRSGSISQYIYFHGGGYKGGLVQINNVLTMLTMAITRYQLGITWFHYYMKRFLSKIFL